MVPEKDSSEVPNTQSQVQKRNFPKTKSDVPKQMVLKKDVPKKMVPKNDVHRRMFPNK